MVWLLWCSLLKLNPRWHSIKRCTLWGVVRVMEVLYSGVGLALLQKLKGIFLCPAASSTKWECSIFFLQGTLQKDTILKMPTWRSHFEGTILKSSWKVPSGKWEADLSIHHCYYSCNFGLPRLRKDGKRITIIYWLDSFRHFIIAAKMKKEVLLYL